MTKKQNLIERAAFLFHTTPVMTSRHPVQALASTPELLITASDRQISTFDAA